MKLVHVIKILLLTLSVAMFSCTRTGEGILNNQSTISETVDNYTKQAPFAYDIAADTISYNSCPNFAANGATTAPFPALTIGVNEGFVTNNGNGAVKGGLKLRTAFLQHIGRYIKPQSPSTTVTPEQVKFVLQNSTANAGAYLQYSIRKKTDLTLNIDLIAPGSGSGGLQTLIPSPGRDAILFLQDLTTGYVGHTLTKDVRFTTTGTVLSEGPRTYNLSDTVDPVPIQGSFGLNQTIDDTYQIPSDSNTTNNPENFLGLGEYYSDYVRKKFNSTGNDRVILTAVFGGKATDTTGGEQTEETISQIRRATTDVSKAFGRGYSLKFESKNKNVAGWVNNVMSGTAVTEFDLSTGTTVQGAQWTCENFIIALPAHWDNKKLGEPTCSPLMAGDLTGANAARQLAVKKIRRQHSALDWNIGLFIPKDTVLGTTVQDRIANRSKYQICVSPRRNNCYLPTTNIFSPDNAGKDAGIQYDTSKECYLTAYNLMGANYTSATTPDAKRLLGRCANYLSVCTRSSTNF